MNIPPIEACCYIDRLKLSYQINTIKPPWGTAFKKDLGHYLELEGCRKSSTQHVNLTAYLRIRGAFFSTDKDDSSIN